MGELVGECVRWHLQLLITLLFFTIIPPAAQRSEVLRGQEIHQCLNESHPPPLSCIHPYQQWQLVNNPQMVTGVEVYDIDLFGKWQHSVLYRTTTIIWCNVPSMSIFIYFFQIKRFRVGTWRPRRGCRLWCWTRLCAHELNFVLSSLPKSNHQPKQPPRLLFYEKFTGGRVLSTSLPYPNNPWKNWQNCGKISSLIPRWIWLLLDATLKI